MAHLQQCYLQSHGPFTIVLSAKPWLIYNCVICKARVCNESAYNAGTAFMAVELYFIPAPAPLIADLG